MIVNVPLQTLILIIVSGPLSRLKYVIAVSPEAVTVAVDNDSLVDQFLDDSIAVGYRSGFCSAAAIELANMLPMDTIIELCNPNDSMVGEPQVCPISDMWMTSF
jgi:hypothetical protein